MFRSRYFKGLGAVIALILVIYSIRDSGIQPRLQRKFSGQDVLGIYRSLTNRGIYQSAYHDGVKEPPNAHISDESKLLFIQVAFADQRRIETSFLFDDKRDAGHPIGGHHKLRDFDRDFFEDYYKFAVVRHPCSRLVAAWNYFVQGLGNAGDKEWVEKNFDGESLTSFDAFVENVLFPGGTVHVEQNGHLQTQVGMMIDDNGEFGLDQLLVFERWNESVAQLAKSLKSDVSDLAMTPSAQKSCQEMYTASTWEKLTKVYALDFCALGYSTKIGEASAIPLLDVQTSDVTRRFADCSSMIEKESVQVLPPSSGQSPASTGETTDPCMMYTYYSEVKTEYTPPEKRVIDQKTIDTWKKWWSAAGWKPRVLSEDDAKSHPQYHELREKFMALPTVNPKEYEMACFMRYVALAAVGGGWMSDFDMLPFAIPTCLKPLYGGNFTGHQLYVPSLVSASSSEYTRFANRLANVDYKKNPELYTVGNNSHVSDMHVMSELWSEGEYHAKMTVVGVNEVFNETPVCETHAEREDMPDGFPGRPWAIHYSHQAITRLRDASGNKTEIWPGSKWNPDRLAAHTDLMRAEFMEDSIEYIFKLCNINT